MSSLQSYLKSTVLSNWSIIRILQLLIGIYLIYKFIETRDPLGLFVGIMFLFQSITNTGCFSPKGCAVESKPQANNHKKIEYDEIK